MEPRDHGLEYEEDVRPQPRLTRPCAAWRRESRRLPVNRGEITTRSGRHQTSGGSWQRQNRPRRSATKPQSDGLLAPGSVRLGSHLWSSVGTFLLGGAAILASILACHSGEKTKIRKRRVALAGRGWPNWRRLRFSCCRPMSKSVKALGEGRHQIGGVLLWKIDSDMPVYVDVIRDARDLSGWPAMAGKACGVG